MYANIFRFSPNLKFCVYNISYIMIGCCLFSENRVAIETEIRKRSVIVRKMRKRRMNGVNWRGRCERKRQRIRR